MPRKLIEKARNGVKRTPLTINVDQIVVAVKDNRMVHGRVVSQLANYKYFLQIIPTEFNQSGYAKDWKTHKTSIGLALPR